MEITLRVEDCDQTPHISVEELVERLLRQFPAAVVNRERGDVHVQEGLNRLIRLEAPDVILDAHRSYFGNVVFVSISDSQWAGASATSYLHTMWPPLGDAVLFEVEGANDEMTVDLIARELAGTLGMVRCSELRRPG